MSFCLYEYSYMTAIVIEIINIYNKDDKIFKSVAKHVILKEKKRV